MTIAELVEYFEQKASSADDIAERITSDISKERSHKFIDNLPRYDVAYQRGKRDGFRHAADRVRRDCPGKPFAD